MEGLALYSSLVLLNFVPLTHSIEFEWSFASSLLLLAFCFGFYQKLLRYNFAKLQTTFLFIPVAAFVCLAAMQWQCLSLDAIGFFILMPVITGQICILSLSTYRKRWLPLAWLAILSLPDIFSLLISTRLYLTGPIVSYFPGPIYDEWIPHRSVVWASRLLTYLFFFANYQFQKQQNRRIYAPFLILTGLVLVLRIYTQFGVKPLTRSLNQTENVNQVVIHHTNGEQSQNLHWGHYARGIDKIIRFIESKYQLPQTTEKIHVFVYPSPYDKKMLTGTEYTLIGNPFQKTLHLLRIPLSSSTLIHELTHVTFSSYGYHGFSPNLPLLEGLAVAVTGYQGRLSVHEWAAALLHRKLLPEEHKLFSGLGFWTLPSSIAYLALGSFCRWLIDEYGIAKFKEYYGGHSLIKVYGTDNHSMVERWKGLLKNIPMSDMMKEDSEYLVQARSVFHKKCPHSTAQLMHRFSSCNGLKGAIDTCENLIQKAYKRCGGEPELLVTWMQYRHDNHKNPCPPSMSCNVEALSRYFTQEQKDFIAYLQISHARSSPTDHTAASTQELLNEHKILQIQNRTMSLSLFLKFNKMRGDGDEELRTVLLSPQVLPSFNPNHLNQMIARLPLRFRFSAYAILANRAYEQGKINAALEFWKHALELAQTQGQQWMARMQIDILNM